MKKLILIAAVAAVMGACTTGNHVADAEQQSLDTAGLIERVNSIYQGAFEQYNRMDSLRKAGEASITMAKGASDAGQWPAGTGSAHHDARWHSH